jgi:hypothetical protein
MGIEAKRACFYIYPYKLSQVGANFIPPPPENILPTTTIRLAENDPSPVRQREENKNKKLISLHPHPHPHLHLSINFSSDYHSC